MGIISQFTLNVLKIVNFTLLNQQKIFCMVFIPDKTSWENNYTMKPFLRNLTESSSALLYLI